MNEEQEKYLNFLFSLYLAHPAIVLTVVSGNSAYEKAGDLATLRVFGSLKRLCTGPCEKRKDTWWRKRYSILGKLLKKKIINKEDFEEFVPDRRIL